MLGGSNVTWEIRAGGTGKLLMPDGQASLYGCSTCNDLELSQKMSSSSFLENDGSLIRNS